MVVDEADNCDGQFSCVSTVSFSALLAASVLVTEPRCRRCSTRALKQFGAWCEAIKLLVLDVPESAMGIYMKNEQSRDRSATSTC